MTNVQLGYNDLQLGYNDFLIFFQCWSPLSQSWLNLEEFIVDVIAPSLLPFFVKEFINCWFQVSIWNPGFIGGQI